jgi:hypothetical protein
VAQDETLRVVAALSGNQEVLKGLDIGSDTLFFRRTGHAGHWPVTAKLRPRMSGVAPGGLPEAWVGRFAPPHGQGEGMLRILALGKSFQRLIAIPLAVTGPWYQGTMVPAGGQGEPALRFRPAPNRRLEGLRGSLTVKSAQGGLAGVLIKPAPGGRDPADPATRLPGGLPGGPAPERDRTRRASGGDRFRPPTPGGPPGAAGKNLEPASPQTPNGKAQKSPQTPAPTPKRRWFWLALSGLGIAVFLGAAVLLFRLRSEGGDAGEKIQGEGSGKNVLTLKAQVEILTKEKAQLLEALNDKKNQMASLAAEKADLQGALDRIKEKTQNSVKSIEDLEKNLWKRSRRPGICGRNTWLCMPAINRKRRL